MKDKLLAPFRWIRCLFRLVKHTDHNIAILAQNLDAARTEIDNAVRFIKRATKVHIDAEIDAQSTVIVCGTFRGKDHVQVFRINPGSFDALVHELRGIQKYSTIEYVDAPADMSATVKREIKL